MPYRTIQIWSSPWSTRQSSKFTVTRRAQKGDPKPSHRQVEGRLDPKILALTDALGNLVRFILLPGHRFDTVGIAPLIKDIEFGGLIADKAFDSNWIVEDLNERKAKIV